MAHTTQCEAMQKLIDEGKVPKPNIITPCLDIALYEKRTTVTIQLGPIGQREWFGFSSMTDCNKFEAEWDRLHGINQGRA